MDKKLNTWAFAILALVVVVLLVGAIGASITGHGIFDWIRKNTVEETNSQEIYNGLLAEAYIEAGNDKEYLKGYEVKYDENGNMIYDIVKGCISEGEGYELIEDPENPLKMYYAPIGGEIGGGVLLAANGGGCKCSDDDDDANKCRRRHGFPFDCFSKDGSCSDCKKDNSASAVGSIN